MSQTKAPARFPLQGGALFPGSWGVLMESLVTKRSVAIDGLNTSVSLEQAFWNGLKEIAADRKVSLTELIESIKSQRITGNLSSAIRLFVLDHYRLKAAQVTPVANVP